MFGTLVPVGGGAPIPLEKETLILGGHRTCDIVLEPSGGVECHAKLVLVEGAWHVEGGNGILVNGVPVVRETVRPKDVLTLGRHQFKIEYDPVALGGASASQLASAPKISDDDILSMMDSDDGTEDGTDDGALGAEGGQFPFAVSSEQSPSRGELIPVEGGDSIALPREELAVGRRECCDVVLRFSSISGIHAQMAVVNGYWYVRDKESKNGTRVNGVLVSEQRLDPEDVVSFGREKYTIRYEPSDLGATGLPPPDVLGGEILKQSLFERTGLTSDDFEEGDFGEGDFGEGDFGEGDFGDVGQ